MESKDSEAAGLLSPDLAMLTASSGGTKAFLDRMTRNRTSAGLEISKEESDGHHATVHCVITLGDGRAVDEKMQLIKKDSRWLITIDQEREKARLLKQIETNARTLLVALEKNDFETVFPLDRDYLDEIAMITSQKPKPLWPELVDKEFKSWKARFLADQKLWQKDWPPSAPEGRRLNEVVGLASLMKWLPRWQIIEVKESGVSQYRKGQWIPVFAVYVTFEFNGVHPLLKINPKIAGEGSKSLKSGILQLSFDSNGLWLGRADLVEVGRFYREDEHPSTVASGTTNGPVISTRPIVDVAIQTFVLEVEETTQKPAVASGAMTPPSETTSPTGGVAPDSSSPNPVSGGKQEEKTHFEDRSAKSGTPVDGNPVASVATSGGTDSEKQTKAMRQRESGNSADSAWAVIERAIKLTGGKGAWGAKTGLKTRSEGRFVDSGSSSLAYAAETHLQIPDRLRNQMKVNRSKSGPEQVLLVLDGETGWRRSGSRVQKLPSSALAEIREETYGANLLWLMSRADRAVFDATLLGDQTLNGQTLTGVEVTSQGHARVGLFFDKDTGLLMRRVQSLPAGEGRYILQETSYSEYKEFDGLKLATKFSVSRNGRYYAEARLLDAGFSAASDSGLFARP
jgi:hypothetical protein